MPTRDEVWTIVREVVAEMVRANGFELEDIQPETLLNSEMGLTSIDAIHMMLSLEERLGSDVDLEDAVIKDNTYVADLSMRELHEHVCETLAAT